MSKTLNVLLVEDSADDAQLIKRELELGGYVPYQQVVTTADEMNKALQKDIWDIVIADYKLPDFNGMDALRMVKQSDVDLPVIMISAAVGEEFAVEAMKGGAQDYVMKSKLVRLLPSIEREMREAKERSKKRQIEKKLQESEARYYGLFEESPTPLWVEDLSAIKKFIDDLKAEGVDDFGAYFDSHPDVIRKCLDQLKIIDVSKETLKLYGISEKETIIQNPKLVFEQKTYHTLKQEIISLAAGELFFENEILTKTLSGDIRYVLFKLSVMPGYEESLARVLVSTTDITERKAAERELRIKDVAFESSLTGIGLEDFRGRLTYVNRAMLNMWGFKNDSEVVGKNGIDFWHDRKKAKHAFKQILTNGRWNGELTAKRKDGKTFEVQVAATLIRDENGAPSLLMGSFEDITERKNGERAIKESEAIFHALFEKNQAVILLLDVNDSDLKIVDANEAALRYYGYSKADLLNMTIMDLNTLPARVVRKKMAAGRRENKNLFEFKHCLASGEIRDVETFSGPIDVHGRKLVYVAVKDITEQCKMEKALQESEQQFRMVFEHAPIGIATVGLDYQILKANSAFCETLGYSIKELQRMKFIELTHPYDVEENLQLHQKLLSG
ncbi:MAG: PAS domain S-box protein, partial [bacterium]|nr:PAS domain S-box protein [bacterium]